MASYSGAFKSPFSTTNARFSPPNSFTPGASSGTLTPFAQPQGFGQQLISSFLGSPLQSAPPTFSRPSESVAEPEAQPGFFGRIGDFVKENKDVLGMAGKTAAGVAQFKMAMDEQNARRRQEEDERAERERKRRNDEAMAPLRAQLLAMMTGRVS